MWAHEIVHVIIYLSSAIISIIIMCTVCGVISSLRSCMLVYLFSHCCAGPKALEKFKRLMMCRIKWKPKKAAAGEWACVWSVWACVYVVQQVCGRMRSVCGAAGVWACVCL